MSQSLKICSKYCKVSICVIAASWKIFCGNSLSWNYFMNGFVIITGPISHLGKILTRHKCFVDACKTKHEDFICKYVQSNRLSSFILALNQYSEQCSLTLFILNMCSNPSKSTHESRKMMGGPVFRPSEDDGLMCLKTSTLEESQTLV